MSVDRGYLNLVSHLNRRSTNIPLNTVLGSVAHYLARVQPSATPLAAIVISSTLFRPSSYDDLDGLVTAFRHAVHLKIKVVVDEPSGLFSRGLAARVAEWVAEVLKGLQGGHSVLRLACCAGLLRGMTDRDADIKLKESSVRRKVEEELVVALAEVVEYACASPDAWEAEFRTRARQEQDIVPATLVIASRCLSFVAPHRLRALPLLDLCRILRSALVDAFQGGAFLQGLPDSAITSTESQFSRNVNKVAGSLLFAHMATLSAMYAQVISVLAESRPTDAWSAISEVIRTLDQLVASVEDGWSSNPLAGINDENSLSPQTKDLAVQVWTVLKTLLFTCIRLLQQVLTVVLFISPLPSPSAPAPSAPDSPAVQLPSPFDITHATLRTLSHLSFVLPHFGGVSSTSSSALPELLKAFYTALDVLSTSPDQSRLFIQALQQEVYLTRQKALPNNIVKAKEAYALACVEQLVPVLDDWTVREDVWPMCEPHLNDPSHRETYESAHSVMLAVFSAHAKRRRTGDASVVTPSPSSSAITDASSSGPTVDATELVRTEGAQLPFGEQVVPAYARCLIDNSFPDKLNTTQLSLAYAALVGCASVFGSSQPSPGNNSSEEARTRTVEGDAYAWFCIALLLDAIKANNGMEIAEREKKQRGKLFFALISTVPSVSLRLLPRLLTSILALLEGSVSESAGNNATEGLWGEIDDRAEIIKALFEELLNVGDEEKEYAIWWWGEHKAMLAKLTDGKGQEIGNLDADYGDSGNQAALERRRGKGKVRQAAARL